MSGDQGTFKGRTTDVDKRHGDPEMGGLTSGEKAALSRGQQPKSLEGNPEKQEAAQRYLAEKQGEGAKGSKGKKH